MSVFPLTIIEKEDSPERLQELADVPLKSKWLASDFNEMRAALIELHGRSFHLDDTNGKSWLVIKGKGNNDSGAFQAGDKIEAWIDEATKTEYVEGKLMSNDFTGVADLDDPDIFFETNRKLRLQLS
ncbi:hypothetical protein [Maribacter flavus]|uniref:Uncharacterized protein n=1 Tax=Maribacter flavus TaxID=1658664 RepID=A0A5B2TUT6_9FLAO|nr:hypothetical protein [Maribacter flavus]KAA2218271.1 hypothetical protein F0361_01225 [Maribacter flavus]